MHTIYIQNIHTKHDKAEHTWNIHAYIYIKPLRLDPKKQKNTPNQILGYV